MNWREEAKEFHIALYDHTLQRIREKEDVLRDIEVTKNVCKDIKITVIAKEATEICRKALFEHVSKLGMVNATCEQWFLNCKRKGIVFKGQKNDDNKLDETETESGEGSGTSEYVPSEGKR